MLRRPAAGCCIPERTQATGRQPEKGGFSMKTRRFAFLTAAVLALSAMTALPQMQAFAADGAGGYAWVKTDGYQLGTDTVTDSGGTTTVTFKNADQKDNVAGFCAENGDGWDWSDYTQLSFTVKNDAPSDVGFQIAVGTGAKWNWHQTNAWSVIGAGESIDLTYYLNSEEWTYDGTVTAIADLYEVHRLSMMVMPAAEGTTVSGSVTVSDLKLGGSASVSVEPKDGFYVDGAVLRDANQNPFIMRGTNYAYTWYSWDGKTEAGLKEIADYGANVVRIVLGDGDQYTKNTAGEIANLIKLCEANKLVAVFEVHDATGKNETQPLLNAAKYFANDIASALKGHEDTVIINIANEWQGNANDTAWQAAYIEAVKIVRDAGLKHCIMCDAGGWGQTATTVINGGKAVLESDPEHNVMFSVHMYGYAGGSQSMIKNIMDSMKTRGLCLVIGEFGYKHSDGDVDEAYIMEYAEQTGTGWMAWSWYGNGSPVEYLDMANANAGGQLSPEWGEVVINGANGWKETAKPASVFTGEAPATTAAVTTTTVTTTTTTTTVTTTVTTAGETTTVTTVTSTETTASGTTTETTASAVSSELPEVMRGDVNCDGTVDVKDAVALARYVGNDEGSGLSEAGMRNAECDGREGIGTDDLTMLLRIIAKLV